MTTMKTQPWQDEHDPQCIRCHTTTPYGKWVTDIPAHLLYPTDNNYLTEGHLCLECIDLLGGPNATVEP